MGRTRLDDDVNTAMHFDREVLHDILEYAARRAKREGWTLEKLQDEICAYYLTATAGSD